MWCAKKIRSKGIKRVPQGTKLQKKPKAVCTEYKYVVFLLRLIPETKKIPQKEPEGFRIELNDEKNYNIFVKTWRNLYLKQIHT